jgi:hypothetical protein
MTTKSNVEMYIARVNESMEPLDNPFGSYDLPFPTDRYSDFQLWERRMDTFVYDDVDVFVNEAVSLITLTLFQRDDTHTVIPTFQKCYLVRIVEAIYHGAAVNHTSTADDMKPTNGMPGAHVGKHFGRLLLSVICTEK